MPGVSVNIKPNLRNTRIFREELLAALGVTDDLDVENEQNFKSALLNALNVEHGYQDIANFEAWREKLIEAADNISEGGGGGGGTIDYNMAKLTVKTTAPISGPDGIGGETYAMIDITPVLPENYTFTDETPILTHVGNRSLNSLTTPVTFDIICGKEGAMLRLTCDRVEVNLANSTYSGDITWNSDNTAFIITGDSEIIINNA